MQNYLFLCHIEQQINSTMVVAESFSRTSIAHGKNEKEKKMRPSTVLGEY